ncbi:hypothetical protein BJ165DRAFT_1528224 [Panaeolus papilionaceus]|nr:hypothetical protein BJ165DRAFT_1528224 [Panaeolus papilionaceus]
MKLFTTTQLTITLALVVGMIQAVPLSSEASGTSNLALQEIFEREPHLFYGRQSAQGLEERGLLGFFGKMAGKAIEKVGGEKASGVGKVVSKVFSLFG